MLIDNRVNLKRVQTLMGHEDIKTTLNVYGHLIERVEAAEKEKTSVLMRLKRSFPVRLWRACFKRLFEAVVIEWRSPRDKEFNGARFRVFWGARSLSPIDDTPQLAHRASKASMNDRSHRPSRMLCIVASSLAR
jgi:hypothetical protein